MRDSTFRLMGSTGLLIAISAGLSAAWGQEAARPAGAPAAGAAAARSTEMLITHALDMALDGSELQLIIRQAGGPVSAGRADAGGAARAVDAARGGLLQLQQRTRRAFRESHELMKTGNRLLRSGPEDRADRAAASRLYAASNLYVNSLYTIGRQTFGWEAGWEPADRAVDGEERPGKTEKTEGGTAPRSGATPRMSTADVATITLINHSVKEALGAFQLGQSVRDAGTTDASAQQLRRHAKEMAAESRQSIDRIVASLHEKEAAAGAAGGAQGHDGWSGSQVQSLAQQAREVIRVYTELSGD